MSLDLAHPHPPLVIVVGSGGVGKTTLAASLGLVSAEAGHDTLVMTFDPSRRLKDTLGVDDAAGGAEVEVDVEGAEDTPSSEGGRPAGRRLDGRRLDGRRLDGRRLDGRRLDGRLCASLLDARETFDRLVSRYAPDDEARDRILGNRYYDHLAGHLGGILEYMAVERLYEVATEGRYGRIILDTPPAREAIDFLEAPQRIVDFLDSGALKIALRPWFDGAGHLHAASGLMARLGFVDRRLESFLDRIVGLGLLRDMSEFFRAFEPLFAGFRERAERVRELLADRGTVFVLVTGPGEQRIPDTLFFARRLREAGYNLGPVVVNRVHPEFPEALAASSAHGSSAHGSAAHGDGPRLFHWLGARHGRALGELRRRLTASQALVALPLVDHEPTDLGSLAAFGHVFQERLRALEAG